MKNVILVDFHKDNNWEFAKKINEYEPFEVKGIQTNKKFHHTKIGTIIRYLIYFLYPLSFVLCRRQKYDKVIAWQQFYGINFAFWSRLLHVKKLNYLAIDTFIFKRRGGQLGNLYYKYIKWSIDNKYVDKIICYSSTEPEFYAKTFNMPLDKFCYVPLGIDRIENIQTSKGDYVFTTGRSNRDYDFLIDSLSGTEINIKIACSGYTYNGNSNTVNVEVLQNCFGKDMQKELANSFCVVMPLKDTHISSGQLVILLAMQLCKPVIVTENDTAKDYIEDGKTGFFIKKDANTLKQTISKLHDRELYNEISVNAKNAFEEKFSLSGLAKNIWTQIS